ncbi:hypothetical protein [Streptomyces cadmiisoli]|uniref:hypothetical protein n=1 Tax=Streptomyces cadmiisoli TaxID=2184053 RepID=UPI003652A5C4
MHRTTTTVTLLVTMAASALAGCATVHRPAGPAGPQTQSPATRPDGRTQPQIVQAPAREALERIGPSRHPRPTAPTAPVTSSEPGRTAVPAPPKEAEPRAPREPSQPARSPSARVPDTSGALRETTDVCALGRDYGGWRSDSPQAVICERTYRR